MNIADWLVVRTLATAAHVGQTMTDKWTVRIRRSENFIRITYVCGRCFFCEILAANIHQKENLCEASRPVKKKVVQV